MGLRLNGSTSGYVELNAPATAGTTTLELPTDSIKPGMVLVAAQPFSAVSSVSVNNCFTATYDTYRIVIDFVGSTDAELRLRHRASGTDSSGTTYYNRFNQLGATYATTGGASSSAWLGYGRVNRTLLSGDMGAVRLSAMKTITCTHQDSNGTTNYVAAASQNGDSTVFDGFTIFPSTGTITGSLQVFGYRKTL